MESQNSDSVENTYVVREPQKPTDRMLKFFTYAHLPQHLQEVSRPFCELADHIVATQSSNPERTVGLRKLLEAKDCIVRSALEEK